MEHYQKKRRIGVRDLTTAGIIAALYVVLTLLSAQFGLSGTNVIHVRVSEALTILPYFSAAAIPGLTLGCLLANLLTSGVMIWDVLFGTLATLLGAVGTYLLRRWKWLAPVPPIVANTLIVPFVLAYGYDVSDSVPFLMLTVGAGEVLSCGVLGMALLFLLSRNGTLFKS